MTILQNSVTAAERTSAPAVTPQDLRTMSTAELDELATAIREQLVKVTSITGGHLGPNLGVVELTIALHREFDSPREPLVWDTGHQAYVHKMLTGRWDLAGLRQRGGVSGYPERAESEHDIVQNSHASGSIAWAHGIDRGRRALGEPAAAVAIIGDGALTGGIGLEALNELASDTASRTVVVLNDNTRSYAPTVGGVALHLQDLRTGEVEPEADMFSQMGLTYIGPVDGHDLDQLGEALRRAHEASRDALRGAPVVHVVTRKGLGFERAEQDRMDHWHSTGPFAEEDPAIAESVPPLGAPKPAATWTAVLGESVLEAARADERVVAISAAMVDPVGLTPMQEEMPDRVIDVGIAEQLAVATAAGISYAGAKPVVALYATFLNRAFDQLLMDAALHGEDLTITLDRAGVTGDDGPSHHGIWDLALTAQIPGAQLFAPRDGTRLREAVPAALAQSGVSLVRFSKGATPADLPALSRHRGLDVLHGDIRMAIDVFVIALGPLAHRAVEAARTISAEHPSANVVVLDPVQALPLPEAMLELAAIARAVVTIEDGVLERGIGEAIAREISTRADRGHPAPPVRTLGVRQGFPAHATRDAILSDMGLDVEGIAESVRGLLG